MMPTPQGHDGRGRPSDTDTVSDTFVAHPAPSALPAAEPVAGAELHRDAQPGRPFPTARRGYDPTAVDEHLGRVQESLHTLRAALSDSERRREQAEQHALAVEDEIRVARAGQPDGLGDAGFGARAERMLRLAETEAADVRAQSARTAAELIDRARREAEEHRHNAEQQAIAAAARAEEYAARRTTAVQEREHALADFLLAVRSEADGIREAAARAAEAHRATAVADARDERDTAAREITRAKAEASAELDRLRTLRRSAREDLGTLATALLAAVQNSEPRAEHAADGG